MSATAMAWRPRLGTPWAITELSAGLRGYVLALPFTALGLAIFLISDMTLRGRDVAIAGLLLGAGSLSVEATRRLGEPAGTVVKDLLSAWWLPMAVLLPPVFVLLAPFPLMALTQWRVRPTLVYRRMFSAASIGLSYAAASLTFRALIPPSWGPPVGLDLLRWAVAAAVLGLFAAVLNNTLIAVAVKAADQQTQWRDLLANGENWRLDAVEASLGVMVAVMIAFQPVLVVFTLAPVLLLQRGLLHAQLRAAALLDSKTGLLNAPTWEREAEGQLLALRRAGRPAAVLLVDVDHFKRVNDTHGHLIGDAVLRSVAATLTTGLRDGDLLGRFGGEEFVALLPGADAKVAAWVAERLRSSIAEHGIPIGPIEDPLTVHVTVSIGMATSLSSDLSALDLLAAADHCMYLAKAAGRNQVMPQLHGGA